MSFTCHGWELTAMTRAVQVHTVASIIHCVNTFIITAQIISFFLKILACVYRYRKCKVNTDAILPSNIICLTQKSTLYPVIPTSPILQTSAVPSPP